MSLDSELSAETQHINPNFSPNISENSSISQSDIDIQIAIKVFVLDFPFALTCAAVFVIYACLWDRQKVHGWIVMAISASFCIRSLIIAVRDGAMHVLGWNIMAEAPEFCVFLGVLHHLAYLSSCCWTLVLAFNLWNRVRQMTKLGSKTGGTKRLILYATFGFGVPAINVLMACILEWKLGLPDHWKVKTPQYERTCKVFSSVSFFYLGIPNALLMVPNLIFFGHSLFHLWRTSRMSKAVGSRRGQQVNATFVRRSLKVFLFMGGLFIVDSVFYFSGFYKTDSYFKVPVETVCRLGMALACAWVFICNEKVQGQLIEKYPRGIGRLLLHWK